MDSLHYYVHVIRYKTMHMHVNGTVECGRALRALRANLGQPYDTYTLVCNHGQMKRWMPDRRLTNGRTIRVCV